MKPAKIQFGFRKLGAIVVLNAVLFALWQSEGIFGMVTASICGASLSAILVLGKRSDIVPCILVAAGCLAGTVTIGPRVNQDIQSSLFTLVVSATVGGMLAMLLNALLRYDASRPPSRGRLASRRRAD